MIKKIALWKLIWTLAFLPTLAHGAGVTAAKGKTVIINATGGGSGTCPTCVQKAGDTMTGQLILSNTSLALTGVGGNVVAAGSVTANQYFGDVSQTTGYRAANVAAGTLGPAVIASSVGVNAISDDQVSPSANISESKIASLVSDLAGKVSKAGDTMTGQLVMTGTSAAGLLDKARDSQGVVADFAPPSKGSVAGGIVIIRSTNAASGIVFGEQTSSTIDPSVSGAAVYDFDKKTARFNGPGFDNGVSVWANKTEVRGQNSASAGLTVNIDSMTLAADFGINIATAAIFGPVVTSVSSSGEGRIYYDPNQSALMGSENGSAPFKLSAPDPPGSWTCTLRTATATCPDGLGTPSCASLLSNRPTGQGWSCAFSGGISGRVATASCVGNEKALAGGCVDPTTNANSTGTVFVNCCL